MCVVGKSRVVCLQVVTGTPDVSCEQTFVDFANLALLVSCVSQSTASSVFYTRPLIPCRLR